ncbi:MAG: apolipoprotein N-acyltransferase, partial [Ignavibacteriaceae bacterium]
VGSWQDKADPFLMISGVVLVFFNPLLFLIPSTLYYFSKKNFPNRKIIFLFPFFWVTYEYIYMLTDASFPWLTLGSGLSYFTSFIQIADIIGAVGLSFIIILVNILLYKIWMKFKVEKKISLTYLIILLFLFAGVLVYGNFKLSNFKLSKQKVRVGLIQPNIDPWAKWEFGNITELTDLYFELSQKAINNGAELLIWPETALPVFLRSSTYTSTLNSLYDFLEKNNTYLLTGIPDIVYYDKDEKKPSDVRYSKAGDFYYTTYNGVYLLSPDSKKIQRYGKIKLVPFGERVPFVDALPFLADFLKWGVGISGWNVGKDTVVFKMKLREQNVLENNDSLKINALVCYESIYPFFVSEFVKRGAGLISVITNDSWYGKLSGPYQHKEIAVLRAVENRRSVVRAANGGISCIIDPLGEIIVETKMLTKDIIVGDVVIQKDETFFTKNPLIVPVLCSVFSVWITALFFLKKLKLKLKV